MLSCPQPGYTGYEVAVFIQAGSIGSYLAMYYDFPPMYHDFPPMYYDLHPMYYDFHHNYFRHGVWLRPPRIVSLFGQFRPYVMRCHHTWPPCIVTCHSTWGPLQHLKFSKMDMK